MIWYLLNIMAIILAWLFPVRGRNNPSAMQSLRTKQTCIVGAFNWIILSGFRAYSVGADTQAYKISFENLYHQSWYSLWHAFVTMYSTGEGDKDPGYALLEKIFQVFSQNYTVWLLFIAIIFTIPMAVMIYRYSKNACISWILYSTLFYAFFAITGHRQTIATAIALWGGLEAIRERKLFRFLV